jgi:hypothetical protein
MPAVTDTSPEIAAAVRERIMKFSGAERFIMGAQMFESARAVVLASLPKNISEAERRRILFERFYGDLPSSAEIYAKQRAQSSAKPWHGR